MKRYTETVKFQPNKIGKKCIVTPIVTNPPWVPQPFPQNPIWNRINKDFDPEHFMYSCPPVDMGKVELEGTAETRVLRCPIKVRGSSKIYLPEELKCCMPLVRHVVETELSRQSLPKYLCYYAHISYENVKIQKGSSQRAPGWHVDGFQGVREPRHQIEHSYIWSDKYPTEYCIQPFFMQHLDPSRHNAFDEMVKQANGANVYKGLAGHVYLIDPYVVHRSTILPKDCTRQFARITFSMTELRDAANTKNLGIELEQAYPERLDVRDRLSAYAGAVPWDMYGVEPC